MKFLHTQKSSVILAFLLTQPNAFGCFSLLWLTAGRTQAQGTLGFLSDCPVSLPTLFVSWGGSRSLGPRKIRDRLFLRSHSHSLMIDPE